MKIIIILLALSANILFAATDPNENKKTLLKAQITEPITINKTQNIKARFTDLKDKAIELGIDNIFINGKIFYKKDGDYQRLKISWQSLENQAGFNKTNNASLKHNFYSSMTTNDKQILPPQELTIEVDEKVLMAALKELNRKNNKKQIKKIKLDNKTIAALNKPNSADNSITSQGKSSLPEIGSPATEDESTSIQEVECPVRYSIEDLRAYEQKSVNTVDSKGNTLDVGGCLDNGVHYPLTKDYATPCTPLVGLNNVRQSYRITGVIAGEDVIVQSECKLDLVDNIIEIQSKTDKCDYQHFIAEGISRETAQKYYVLNGKTHNIGQCEPINAPIAHKQRACEWNLEISRDFAIPTVETYFDKADGTRIVVEECTVKHTQEISVVEQACTGNNRYDHNFEASISYLMKEKWVRNPFSNEMIKIQNCTRSGVTFRHLQETKNCQLNFDNDGLWTLQSSQKIIQDPSENPSEVIIDKTCSNVEKIPYIALDTTFGDDYATKFTNYERLDGVIHRAIKPTQTKNFEWTRNNFGNISWIVPAGITAVYAKLTSGQGGRGPSGCGGSGAAGGRTLIESLAVGSEQELQTEKGSGGGSGGEKKRFFGVKYKCKNRTGSLGSQTKISGVLTPVVPDSTISINLGSGGSEDAANGLVTIKF